MIHAYLIHVLVEGNVLRIVQMTNRHYASVRLGLNPHGHIQMENVKNLAKTTAMKTGLNVPNENVVWRKRIFVTRIYGEAVMEIGLRIRKITAQRSVVSAIELIEGTQVLLDK